jgi:indolepyruvate ferredoxin oxidoreductase, beta subunit
MSSPIRIVIAALGGEGGGVLGNWIADMAAREGYLSQTTSVPGVAQRTGATIYYIELFPRAESDAAGKMPVMSMFPNPGDVDLVICSEIVEAGRMIQRGFVTPDRTTLITSTHRTYGITEKEAMGNGIADKQAIAEVAVLRSKHYIAFDMLETARRFDSVINAALFGALAETGALPFARESFEETIRMGKIAIDSNLATFAESFRQAQAQATGGVQVVDPAEPAEAFSLPAGTTAGGKDLMARIRCLPENCHEMLYLGVKKLVNYQDYRYAHQYLDRVQVLLALEGPDSDNELTLEAARFLALWMAFEDLPRVAQNKISAERFDRLREEVKAGAEQQVDMVEFLHPRVEEFCGVLPARLGRYLQDSAVFSRLIGLFAKPRNVRTNGVFGYVTFYLMAGMRRFRRASLIYQIENGHIENWLDAVEQIARRDYALALELARCGRLVKGYGSTRERGTRNLECILGLIQQGLADSADVVAGLRSAALEDDRGEALQQLRAGLVVKA